MSFMKENINTKLTNPRDLLIQGCERPQEAAVEPFKVAPHVYYVGNSQVGSSYLIETSDGLKISRVYTITNRIR